MGGRSKAGSISQAPVDSRFGSTVGRSKAPSIAKRIEEESEEEEKVMPLPTRADVPQSVVAERPGSIAA